jgi:tetratricopeptide (TPR) repeat protein
MNQPRALQNQAFDEALRHHRAGRLTEAEALYRQTLARDPHHADSLHWLGVIAHQNGRYEEAAKLIEQAIAINDAALYRNNLGNALRRLGRLEDAAEQGRRALALEPDNAETHNNLGITWKDQDKLEKAEAHFRKAAALRPDYAEAHYNLGNVLQDRDALGDAVAHYRRAIDLRPGYAKAHMNCGNALRAQGRREEALFCYRHAIAIKPDYAEAHVNEALTLLQAGNFAEGWPKYEWRWRLDYMKASVFDAPLWDGGDLAGKTILLHSEQGLGDSIQFVRYANMVKARGARVLLSCPASLVRLFETVAGLDRIFPEGATLAAYDCHAPLLSLPRIFETRLETIPRAMPYIEARPDEAARWAGRLQAYDGLKIGLVWAGNPRPGQPDAHAADRRRSMRLDQFTPLATIPGVQFFSLQKGAPGAQAKSPPPGMALIDFMNEIEDFAATAALIANLDLIIGVDTSVIHLAGAMGKPVWLLSRFDGCWRWLLEREDSPWYPSLRLFRQPKIGDWESVVGEIAEALKGLWPKMHSA